LRRRGRRVGEDAEHPPHDQRESEPDHQAHRSADDETPSVRAVGEVGYPDRQRYNDRDDGEEPEDPASCADG
jgi:hypothetical protein